MSAADREGAGALLDWIRLLRRDGLVPAPALRVVERALLDHRVVRLDYQDKHGSVTSGRLVEPLGFVLGEQHTYLHGWCRLRNGPRAFRLDRIRHASITAEPAGERPVAEVECGIPPDSRRARIAIDD
jgi:predicted DNA-binding transcriptional regulator YafY